MNTFIWHMSLSFESGHNLGTAQTRGRSCCSRGPITFQNISPQIPLFKESEIVLLTASMTLSEPTTGTGELSKVTPHVFYPQYGHGRPQRSTSGRGKTKVNEAEVS